MKTATSLFLCVSLLAGATTLQALQPGDNRASVLAEMGNPTGEITAGELTVLVYPRGEIRLREGRVSDINLVSERELAERKADEAGARERAKHEQAARLARLETEGRALRTTKRTDANFAALSATEQLAFWRSFAVRYPMIPVADEIAALRIRASEEERLALVDRANEERLASLEARLAETEDRAARAEREAHRAQFSPWGFVSPGRPYTIRIDRGSSPRDHEWRRMRDPKPESDSAQPGNATSTPDDARAKAMAEIEEARRAAYRAASP